jgi:hypothetical protein
VLEEAQAAAQEAQAAAQEAQTGAREDALALVALRTQVY